jgi:hypothetical protein
MRRAASDPRATSDARLAAERLREASRLLGGMQSQVASGRLGSMSKEADRLVAEERNQADRVNKLKARSAERSADPSIGRDIQQLATDRQRMADDLSSLQQDMRNAARELDAGQRAASSKLREALGAMDESDLETRLQRSADWLRSGVDPNGNGTEAQIASGLQRLSDEMRQAQQALAAGAPGQETNTAESVLNNVERLRRQIEALSGQDGQNQGRESYQAGALSRNEQGSQGSPGGRQGSQGGRSGDGYGAVDGNRQAGAGGRNGTLYGDFDTGNNARPGTPRSAPAQQTPTVDNQKVVQQGLSELAQLRKEVANDPEAQRQVQELITAMEHLDLGRFPGNPAMVEELHQRLLSGVDTLELQLRRKADDKRPGQIRSADSLEMPPGYKDAVADYFRRLSTTPVKEREKPR